MGESPTGQADRRTHPTADRDAAVLTGVGQKQLPPAYFASGDKRATAHESLLEHYARLVVDVGANVQPRQDVAVIAAPESSAAVHAIAARAYERGARFVDAWYFDPQLKVIRAHHALADTLRYVPPWYGTRIKQLGAGHGSRISVTPIIPPGLMANVPGSHALHDHLPSLTESLEVINEGTTNWCVVPWPTEPWARAVYPDLPASEALAALSSDIVDVLHLDEPDPLNAWEARRRDLHEVSERLGEAGLDAVRFTGPGTDLTIGLLPGARFSPVLGCETIDGVVFNANLPSEEILTTPDPCRADGVVTATRPLDLSGTLVEGLRLQFTSGRVIDAQAVRGADAFRDHLAVDAGATRLGELALVDGDSRVGKRGRVFYNTLLDENAASHLAVGNGYSFPVEPAERGRINRSAIHIDFMIGSQDVAVIGIKHDGGEISLLEHGIWQV